MERWGREGKEREGDCMVDPRATVKTHRKKYKALGSTAHFLLLPISWEVWLNQFCVTNDQTFQEMRERRKGLHRPGRCITIA